MTKHFRVGFDVTMEKGSTCRPLKVQFWTDEKKFTDTHPTMPLKYHADALAGLSLIKLNHYLKSPLSTPFMDYSFAVDAWKALDPHIELFDRSQKRMQSWQAESAMINPKICQEFESLFNEHFEMAVKPWGVDLAALGPLLETFSWFEKKMETPLLYNFGLSFSKPFVEKLHSLFCFLYHLRSIVAIDHNAQVQDPSHEGVRIDAITDYLPRAEYVVNDALLYWNYKKYSQPFSALAPGKNSGAQVEKLLVQPLDKVFEKYSHNATYLVNHLPAKFLNSLNPMEMEEAFYSVQMDWLLGSPAGLLFKIREELYGLQSGYERVFWKDIEPVYHNKVVALHLCCEIPQEMIEANKAA
jgi:hypothetical protein